MVRSEPHAPAGSSSQFVWNVPPSILHRLSALDCEVCSYPNDAAVPRPKCVHSDCEDVPLLPVFILICTREMNSAESTSWATLSNKARLNRSKTHLKRISRLAAVAIFCGWRVICANRVLANWTSLPAVCSTKGDSSRRSRPICTSRSRTAATASSADSIGCASYATSVA